MAGIVIWTPGSGSNVGVGEAPPPLVPSTTTTTTTPPAFAPLPELPPYPAVSSYRVIERGGIPRDRAEKIPALWRANGRPDTIGFIILGEGAAGVMGIAAVSGTSTAPGVIAAATGLHERDGRVFGRIALVLTGAPGGYQSFSLGQWYPVGDYFEATGAIDGIPQNLVPMDLTFVSSSGERVTFTYTASGVGDDTYFRWNSIQGTVMAMEGFPGPVKVMRTDSMPFMGDPKVQFAMRAMRTVGTPGSGIGLVDPIPYALRYAQLRSVDPAALAYTAMAWPRGADAWSKSGAWVRRLSWTDLQQMMRHEAGAGTARAVFVIQSSTVAPKRVVRNSEFGLPERMARDWVLAYPPDDAEFDLTDAYLSLQLAPNTADWALFASDTTSTTPGGGGDGHGDCNCCGCP